MFTVRWILLAIAPAYVSGCDLYVPEIQDFGDQTTGQQLVQSIIYNITCEVQDAKPEFAGRGKGSVNSPQNWLPPSPPSAVFDLV
jgi:hypothetical protein